MEDAVFLDLSTIFRTRIGGGLENVLTTLCFQQGHAWYDEELFRDVF